MPIKDCQQKPCDPRMPNLFIVGAQKAATTSLASTLSSHPDIFLSPLKEPHFFVQQPGPDPDFNSLLMAYGNSYDSVRCREVGRVKDLKDYLELFKNGTSFKYRAEASPTNLASPNAPHAISRTIEDPKFIAILRNPYHRTYSGYIYFRSLGREPATCFKDALAHELSGSRDNWIYGQRHIYMSLYSQQLQNYFNFFANRQIHIVLFDDLLSNPTLELERIYDFLSLEKNGAIQLKRDNKSVVHSFKPLHSIKSLISSPHIRRLFPRKLSPKQLSYFDTLRKLMLSGIDKFGSRPQGPEPEDFKLISKTFENEISLLENLLDRDLSFWRIT